jgi:hypothetical protein
MTDTPTPATPVDPPGRPRVPRTRWSMLAIGYAIIGLGLTGWAVTEGLAGRDLIGSSGDVDQVPASVRASPGGYRSFHFWHSGYEGGK